jgi:hypothetical protein
VSADAEAASGAKRMCAGMCEQSEKCLEEPVWGRLAGKCSTLGKCKCLREPSRRKFEKGGKKSYFVCLENTMSCH